MVDDASKKWQELSNEQRRVVIDRAYSAGLFDRLPQEAKDWAKENSGPVFSKEQVAELEKALEEEGLI